MKLITADVAKRLRKFPLYSQDGKGADSEIAVKFFGGSAATWLITEASEEPNGDWRFFGFVTLGLPDPFDEGKLLWEWGYVTLRQLEELRFPPFGLPVERDMYLRPGTTVRDEVFMCGQYEPPSAKSSSKCTKPYTKSATSSKAKAKKNPPKSSSKCLKPKNSVKTNAKSVKKKPKATKGA